MKIAIANHGLYPDSIGGMEKHTFNLAKHLKMRGADVHVLIPFPPTKTAYPFPVHFLPWPKRLFWLWENWEFSRHVGNWIDKERPDIAFGQGFNLWEYVKHRKVPTIFHPHGLEMFASHLRGWEKLQAVPFRRIVRYHGKYADVTLSLGGDLTQILEGPAGIPRKKIREIPNAVDLEDFPEIERKPDPKSFLFVGRFAFNKGIDLLSRALEICRNVDLKLTVMGDGPLQTEVHKLCDRDHRVTLKIKPSSKEIVDAYRKNESLLFTSRFEGMPTVILEAMASGCAVVATKIGAVETMLNKDNGILVPPTAEGIADGIRTFAQLPLKERHQLGKNGRRTVEDRFAWDRVVQKYFDLFSELRK